MNIFEIIFLIPFNPFYENNYIFYSKLFTSENFTIDRVLSIISILIAIFIATFIYYKQKLSQQKSDEILKYINNITDEINNLVTLQSLAPYYHKELFVHHILKRLLKLREIVEVQIRNIDSYSNEPNESNLAKIKNTWNDFQTQTDTTLLIVDGIVKITRPYLNDPTIENRFHLTLSSFSMKQFNFESVSDTYPINVKFQTVRNDIMYDKDALNNLIQTVKEEEQIVKHLQNVTLRLRYYFNQNS